MSIDIYQPYHKDMVNKEQGLNNPEIAHTCAFL